MVPERVHDKPTYLGITYRKFKVRASMNCPSLAVAPMMDWVIEIGIQDDKQRVAE